MSLLFQFAEMKCRLHLNALNVANGHPLTHHEGQEELAMVKKLNTLPNVMNNQLESHAEQLWRRGKWDTKIKAAVEGAPCPIEDAKPEPACKATDVHCADDPHICEPGVKGNAEQEFLNYDKDSAAEAVEQANASAFEGMV